MFNLTGTTLGRYQITERLGRGGMADVYKATHTRLGTLAAIKVLYSHLIEEEDFLARFEREARAAASLRHPNIVRVFDYDFENGHYFIVMDYINGGTLKEKIAAAHRAGIYLPLDEIMRITRQVCEALEYAHQHDMVHRDVKSANILLDQHGNGFLSDFGIAHIVSSTHLTATGSLIGTPNYMSPEQCQGQRATTASDIYSLGMVLFEMFTGQVPFADDTPLAVIHKHIYEPLPAPRQFRPDLSAEQENVILKALERKPEQRFASPLQMLNALVNATAISLESQTIAVPPKPAADTATPEAQTAVSSEPEIEIPEEHTEVAPATSPVPLSEQEFGERTTVADLSPHAFVEPPIFAAPERRKDAEEADLSAFQPTVTDEKEAEAVTVVDEAILPQPIQDDRKKAEEREAATIFSAEPMEKMVIQKAPAAKRSGKKISPALLIGIVGALIVIILLVWGFSSGLFSRGGGTAVNCDSPPSCLSRAWFYRDQGDLRNVNAYLQRMEEIIPGDQRPRNAGFMCDAAEIMIFFKEHDRAVYYAERCRDWSAGLPEMAGINNRANDLIQQLK